MTEKEKSECEKIILYMQEHSGRGDHHRFRDLIKTSPSLHIFELKEKDLVKPLNPEHPQNGWIKLTPKGERFKTFKKYERQERWNYRFDFLKSRLPGFQAIMFWPVTALALASGIYTFYKPNDDIITQTKRIDSLQLKVDTLRKSLKLISRERLICPSDSAKLPKVK